VEPSADPPKLVEVSVDSPKAVEVSADPPNPVESAVEVSADPPKPVEVSVESPVETSVEAVKETEEKKTYIHIRTPKEQKAWQESEEKKKREELDKLSIRRDTILTEENLKRWLVDEKRSCAWIAREKAGCPAVFVSDVAASFNIESEVRRKRREKTEKNNNDIPVNAVKPNIHTGIFVNRAMQKKKT
jgi:hypothetical protein